jgi:hypothetical protein
MLGLSQQLTQVVLVEAKAQGFQILSPDDLVATLGPQPYEELQNCAGRAECSAHKLEPLGVDRAVLGTLGRDEKNYLVHLWLVDLHGHAIVADVDRSILIASRRLLADVKLAVPDLLRGKREARGTLKLEANTVGATATIDGELVGKTPLTIELKPGKHEVKLEKKAFLPITRLLTVAANAVTEEELRLTQIPGEKTEEELLPTLTAQKKAGENEQGFKVPLSAWIALGAGAAAAGTGGTFGYLASHAEQQLKTGYDPQTQIYSGTRAQALNGKQDALIANVAYAVAGAGLATAVVLTLLNQGGDTVQVAPAAGPGSGGWVLRGTF